MAAVGRFRPIANVSVRPGVANRPTPLYDRLRLTAAARAGAVGVADLWSAIIRVVFVSALPLSSDHALGLALAMEYS
jgi:hypothetical protein